jgi:hypothetical protein
MSRCLHRLAGLAALLAACSDGTDPGGQVASVVITLSEPVLAPLESAIFSAQPRDAGGLAVTGVDVTWASSAEVVAQVNANGRVVAGNPGTAEITATADGISASTTVTVAVNLRSASVGSELCGIDGVGAAYCGTFSDALAAVGHPTALEGISAGHLFACGIDGSGIGLCWGSNGDGELGRGTQGVHGVIEPPAPVSGALRFDEIAAGSQHACGIATDGLAYCWGENALGQLGNGSTDRALEPVPVLGAEQMLDIDTDLAITCAIRVDGTAACWGAGHLGNATIHESHQPLGVTSAVTFTEISVAANHACALAATGQAWCWGLNDQGQVGNGAPGGVVDVPTAIGGTLRFTEISAGDTHTCALRGNGEAYCWGAGATGTGMEAAASVPTRVATEHRFATISAGELRTCASTAGGATFCWGERFTAGGSPPDPRFPARIPLIGGA